MSVAILLLVFSGSGFAQTCVGDFDHNMNYHRKGSHYTYIKDGKSYKCIACSGCTPVETGSAGGAGMPAVPGGYGQSFEMQMMSGILGSMIQAALAPPPDNSAWLQQQAALEKAKKEAEQKERLAKWQQLEKEAAGRRKKEKDQLVSMLDVMPLDSDGGGAFDVVDWGAPEDELKPRGTGSYDTAALTSMQRLACANYFARQAMDASGKGDYVQARYLNEQAEQAMTGRPTEIECRSDAMPDVPDVSAASSVDMDLYANVINTVQQDIGRLQDVRVRLRDVEKQKKTAEQKIQKAREELAQLNSTPADPAAGPEEAAQDDQLELEAQRLLAEAESELAAAENDEQELLQEQGEIENNLKAVQQQFQATAADQ